MMATDWGLVPSCGPPGVYRLTTQTCPACTETAGGSWAKPETHVQRECVSKWLGTYYGTKHFFACLHTEDEGILGAITVEEWTVLRVQAEAVSDLYDAYVEADITASSGCMTEAEETAALEQWSDMKRQVRERHRGIAPYVQSLRWILGGGR